jgi:hypothetical protein
LRAAGGDTGDPAAKIRGTGSRHIQAGQWGAATDDAVEVGLAAALIERQAISAIDRAAEADVAVGAVQRRGRAEGDRTGVGLRADGGDAIGQLAGAGDAQAAGAAAVGDGAGAVHQQRAQRQRFVLQVEHAGVVQCQHGGTQAAGAGERQSAAIDRGAVVAVTAGKRQGVTTRLDQIKTHAADDTGERDVARAANAVGPAGHSDGTAVGCRCGAAVDQHTVAANAEAGSGDRLGNALTVEVKRKSVLSILCGRTTREGRWS